MFLHVEGEDRLPVENFAAHNTGEALMHTLHMLGQLPLDLA